MHSNLKNHDILNIYIKNDSKNLAQNIFKQIKKIA